MTCIVAVEHKGRVWMGGDSAANDGEVLQIGEHPKVFVLGEFLIGFTVSFRLGQLLEFNLEVPASKEPDDLRYLVTVFIPALRKCLSDGGFVRDDDGAEKGGHFLLGYRGKVYVVADDYQVTRMTDGYLACGSGYGFALASIETFRDQVNVNDPEKAIREALRVASKFSMTVRPPFTVLSL